MAEETSASIYDFPKYYDLLFGSDWKAEFHFLEACFAKHAECKVKRIFEPACGTGRLLIKLAQAGYEVAGNDLNPKAVAFCNKRFARYGLPETAVVQDMSDFKVRRKFDAAFNMINTFRHLPSEETAAAHLRCMAAAMNKGGIYVLGIHLEPTACLAMQEEGWSARRGNLVVNSYMWSKGIDRKNRMEHLGLHVDVFTPSKRLRIVDHMEYRTYQKSQFLSLVKKVPELEIVETYDFSYEIDQPIRVSAATEDVVYILRKKKN
ncbi:MAG: class I SAM-dependent methyltransferase [Planctomyces sp.]|nr:class I SAM-dependent methyltransferase [Planctomyces sp.]